MQRSTLVRRILQMILPAFVFVACQKELNWDIQDTPPVPLPDLETRVTAGLVSGFVTDGNNQPVQGATVEVGTSTTTTSKYGYFEVSSASVVKNAAVVKVTKPGYFPGIKTYLAKEGKGAFFRIKLLEKSIAGTFSGSAGGSVTLTNGLKLDFPTSAVVIAGTRNAYSGTVRVAAHWINPSATDLYNTMPGDLRGLDTSGYLKTLTTYGMAAVELTGETGELLQLDSARSALLTMPVPAALAANAPATLPLWYFDEVKGLWRQEGTATLNGDKYVGAVKHFSFWNCDVPANFVQFNCTVVDASERPIANALVRMYEVARPNNIRWTFTDTSGYVAGAIPANSELILEIFSDPTCLNYVFTERFTTLTADINRGNIVVRQANSARINGTVNACAGTPVTNGYVILRKQNTYYHAPVNSAGEFNFVTSICDVSEPAILIAEDQATMQQSNEFSFNIVTGNNNVGTLTACGQSVAEFVNYTYDGVTRALTAPAYSMYQQISPNTGNNHFIQIAPAGTQAYNIYFSFTNLNSAVGVTQNLVDFVVPENLDSAIITTPVLVNITEYGNVGQYIAGNFTGSLTGAAPGNVIHNITCNFRIKRNN